MLNNLKKILNKFVLNCEEDKELLKTHIKDKDKDLRSAVGRSKKFIKDRFLTDVAMDLIDEAGASFHMHNQKRKTLTPHDIEMVIAKLTGVPT